MLFYAVYPFDLRILDPSFDGNPIMNELGPHPHVEIGHTVQWAIGTPEQANKVVADHQPMVQRNSKTEKLLPHVPIVPPFFGPGLANTILNKSKCHIYFHNPNIKLEGKDAAIHYPFLAPPLHCAEIKLPLPPCLLKLAVAGKSAKAAKAASEGVAKAKEAVDKAQKTYDDAKRAVTDLKVVAETALKGPKVVFDKLGDCAKAANARKKAEADFDKVADGEGEAEAAQARADLAEIEQIRAEEKRHAAAERAARQDEQWAEREARAHRKESAEWAERSNTHLANEREQKRAAEQHRDEAIDSDDRAAKHQQQGDGYEREHQSKRKEQQGHDDEAARANTQADDADRRAAEADRKRYDHELDSRTAQQIGDHSAEQGKPLTAADEHAKARESAQKAREQQELRDRERARAAAERERADGHQQRAKEAGEHADKARDKASEHHTAADGHRRNAWESRRNAAAADDAAAREVKAARKALDESERAAGDARGAERRAEKAKVRAEKAGHERRLEKKIRKSKQRKLAKSLSPSCGILLPSLTAFIPTLMMHTVFLNMSLLDLLKNWLKVLAIIAADIVDGYLGFVLDSLKSAGKVSKWVAEIGGAVVGAPGNALREWGTTDKLAIKVPVKAGAVEMEFEYVYDPESGETTYKASGKTKQPGLFGKAEGSFGYERTHDADSNFKESKRKVGYKDQFVSFGNEHTAKSDGQGGVTEEDTPNIMGQKPKKEEPPAPAPVTGDMPLDGDGISTGDTPMVE